MQGETRPLRVNLPITAQIVLDMGLMAEEN